MIDTEKLFIKADKEWDKGNLKIAFELFLEGAESRGRRMPKQSWGIL